MHKKNYQNNRTAAQLCKITTTAIINHMSINYTSEVIKQSRTEVLRRGISNSKNSDLIRVK